MCIADSSVTRIRFTCVLRSAVEPRPDVPAVVPPRRSIPRPSSAAGVPLLQAEDVLDGEGERSAPVRSLLLLAHLPRHVSPDRCRRAAPDAPSTIAASFATSAQRSWRDAPQASRKRVAVEELLIGEVARR